MKTTGFNLRKGENDGLYSLFLDSIDGKKLKEPLRLIRSGRVISGEDEAQKLLIIMRRIKGDEIEYFCRACGYNCYAGYYVVKRDEKYYLYYVNIRNNTECIENIDLFTDKINQFKGEK